MRKAWMQDPASVSGQWAALFAAAPQAQTKSDEVSDELLTTAYHLINCYKIRGHQLATIDALKLKDLKEYGKKSHADLMRKEIQRILNRQPTDTPFMLTSELAEKTALTPKKVTLKELDQQLRKRYCGNAGFEFMHLSNN